MAQKYPDIISAAFLMHSIPLNGRRMKYMTASGEPIVLDSLKDAGEKLATMLLEEMNPNDPDGIYKIFRLFSSNHNGYIPKDHRLKKIPTMYYFFVTFY